jgi:WD40 repeat protein/uncharacterized caspase-like protein
MPRTISRPKPIADIGDGKLWILLISVHEYVDRRLSSLPYGTIDGQGLATTLTEATEAFPERSIYIHHDCAAKTPTLSAVRDSLEAIAEQAQPQDTVLFYFCGHGALEPRLQQAVLCLADTQKEALLKTGLTMMTLLGLLGKCAAKHQVVWLDACHGGSMLNASEDQSEPLDDPTLQLSEMLRKHAAQHLGFESLLSCDRVQRSWKFPELGHGVFTYFLMQGLQGDAADAEGVIDTEELYNYVYRQTLNYIEQTNQKIRLINQQKQDWEDLQPEYSLQTPKRIATSNQKCILAIKPAEPSKPSTLSNVEQAPLEISNELPPVSQDNGELPSQESLESAFSRSWEKSIVPEVKESSFKPDPDRIPPAPPPINISIQQRQREQAEAERQRQNQLREQAEAERRLKQSQQREQAEAERQRQNQLREQAEAERRLKENQLREQAEAERQRQNQLREQAEAERRLKENQLREQAEAERQRQNQLREQAEAERRLKQSQQREQAKAERQRQSQQQKQAEAERRLKQSQLREQAEAERRLKRSQQQKQAEAERLKQSQQREQAEAERRRKRHQQITEIKRSTFQFANQQARTIDQFKRSTSRLTSGLTRRAIDQQRNPRARKIIVIALSGAGLSAIGLAAFSAYQHRNAQIRDIKALSAKSDTLLSANQPRQALVVALNAGHELQSLDRPWNILPEPLKISTIATLQQAIMQTQDPPLKEQRQPIAPTPSDAVASNPVASSPVSFSAVTSSTDGQWLATADSTNTITLTKRDDRGRQDPQRPKTFRGHTATITQLQFSPDGKRLASASADKTIKLWNVEKGILIKTFVGHRDRVTAIGFRPDGEVLASGSTDQTIKLWTIPNGELADTFKGIIATTIRFSPDGRILAAGSSDNTIRLWYPDSTQPILLGRHDLMVTDLAFSADGKTIASASWDKTIKLWNISDAKFDREASPYRTLTGHTGGVTSVSFNPNAPVLASGSQDTTIKLWDTQDGTALKTLLGHQDAVKTTLFSADGNKLVSISDRNGMIVWNLNLTDLLQRGCDQLRQLDSRSTSQQLKNLPYTDPQATIDNSIDNSREICSASKS